MNQKFSIELPDDYLHKALVLKISNGDIIEQFIRGGGKGGQKINKTASCVLLKHLPTGLEVRCQKHREQSKNRLSAYKLLIDKIEQAVKGKESAMAQEVFKIRKQKKRRSKKAKEKMLEQKKIRAEIKGLRKKI